VFCVACAVAMLVFPQWQTVPFHWIWITITFLYGFRRWTNGQTTAVLLAVIVVTTTAMLRTPVERAELSEIPLMSCVFLGMVWHVRRRQDAVDEQRRVAEREREFMRDASHSLRTPLTVAQGHAEFLRDGLDPGTEGHHDASVMLDELRRLARISDQLLMLSALGHADALLLAPVALDGLAREAGRRWSAASRREVAVDAPAPVCVLADEQRLRHALDALVENALNATGPGDRVTISAYARAGRAVLAVADTGTGIAPADVGRIFERFERGPGAEGRAGTGLGLPIVSVIAAAHGGSITVDSRPGAGAVFTMTLGAPLPALAAAPRG
jgi:signal transduction histidine kinase